MIRHQGPLAGLRVLEISGIGPGPFAAMLLADMGADVLRIDRPGARGPLQVVHDPRFEIVGRGRRTMTVDLKSPGGKHAVQQLADRADVMVEGFRPGVAERLGIGPEACLERNPRLVYGRMTGWGQNGPLATAAGHDLNYIALSGALAAIGERDRPPVPPLALVGDFGGGGMLLAFGILCALVEARHSGKGQVVDAAIVDGAALLTTAFYGFFASGEWRLDRGENLVDGGAPFYAVYETADRQYVTIAALEPQFFANLLTVLGLDLALAGSQYDRAAWPELRQTLEAIFREKTRDEWCRVMEGKDTCFAPVLSMAEAPSHPHNVARRTFVNESGIVQPGAAPRFSRTPGRVAAVAPVNEDARGVLADWGLRGAEAETLLALVSSGQGKEDEKNGI